MKQSKKYLVMLVATLLSATSVWAGGTVTIIKKLNGTVNESAGTVTSSISEGQCTLTVTPAQGNYIKVANITAERIIDGGSAQSRFKAPGINGNGIEVSATNAAADPSGETTYTFTMPAADYDVEVVADFQGRTSIADAVVTLAETSFNYDGEAKEPTVSSVVLNNEITLTVTTDYTVSYSDNTNAGTATVTVTGQGIYTGEATATFTISKTAITPTVTLTGWTYGAAANRPQVTGNSGNGTVTFTYKAADAEEFSATVPSNAGTHTVKATIAETANYQGGEATTEFTIAKADLTLSLNIQGWTYGDTPNEVTVEGNTGNGTVTITYQGENDEAPTAIVPTNAGGYTVYASVAATANYNSAETFREFSIEQADFSQVVIADIADQTFTGEAITPALTVTFKGNSVDASDYTIAYSNNTSVGQATVTLTTTDKNFTAGDTNPTKTFQIVAAQTVITASNQTVTYDGESQSFSNFSVDKGYVTMTYYSSEDDRTAGENELSVEDVLNAGTYYVKLEQGDDSYTAEPVNVTFTINPRTLTDDMMWMEGDEFIYDGTAKTLDSTLFGLSDDDIDAELEFGVDYTISYTDNVNVGTATATITGQGNYQGTLTQTFSIVRGLDLGFNENRQWATYYAEEDLQVPEGLKAYIVTETGESEVTVDEITYIPQHVGVLLTLDEEGVIPDYITAPAYEGATQTFAANLLQGTSAATAVSSITGGAVYVLFNNEFVKSTTGTIPANRAYLVLDNAVYGGLWARSLSIIIGESSGISGIIADTTSNGQCYNLQGIRLTQPKKGLVIVNGKKLFVK